MTALTSAAFSPAAGPGGVAMSPARPACGLCGPLTRVCGHGGTGRLCPCGCVVTAHGADGCEGARYIDDGDGWTWEACACRLTWPAGPGNSTATGAGSAAYPHDFHDWTRARPCTGCGMTREMWLVGR